VAEAVIAGYDGSEGAGDALSLAGMLASAAGRELVLVCVAPAPGGSDASADDAEKLLADAPVAAEVERRLVADDSVARGLHRVAEAEGASAIVVGTPSRALPGRIAMGTVAERLLHGSPCAVALAPRGHAARAGEFRNIVVAYTASDEARAALRVAAGLAQASGATVRVVSVVGAAPSWHGDPDAWRAGAREANRADLDRSLRALASTVAVEGRVLDGDPVDAVLESAHGWADLIVTGSRGYGPQRRVLLGSVSSGLLERAQVPVLITPRGAETELVGEGGG
jgi:nucleotide-binding universal stress UspA family protein